MPRKYTRRAVPPEATPELAASLAPGGQPVPAGLYAVPMTALEQYGLWLKQNQHVTQALPPEPSQPRKAPNVPRPRY